MVEPLKALRVFADILLSDRSAEHAYLLEIKAFDCAKLFDVNTDLSVVEHLIAALFL